MIPAKPFYLLRHGQTEANVTHTTAGGGLDSPLTEDGKKQAKDLAAVIHQLEIKPSKIIHSPMSRARDTAKFVNEKLELLMHEIDDLREHLVGEWEGLPWEEVFPHLRNNVRPKDGENQDDFATRVKRVLTQSLGDHDEDEGPVLFVAHGGTFFSFLRMHERPYDGHINNCHLHYFEPCPEHGDFPWRIWQFDIEEDMLVKRSAPFCGSQYLTKMDEAV